MAKKTDPTTLHIHRDVPMRDEDGWGPECDAFEDVAEAVYRVAGELHDLCDSAAKTRGCRDDWPVPEFQAFEGAYKNARLALRALQDAARALHALDCKANEAAS